MMTQHTFHIHLKGRVQGVGFRPFVYRLALQHGLKGQVLNAPDGVHIEFNAAPEQARHFFEQVTRQAPRLSHISGQHLQELPTKFFDTFAIVSSDTAAEADLLLSPDFALCADCRRELQAAGDVRHGYAFITCTLCGPRFSIVESLPYDRPLTAMRDFDMCPRCAAEYENPLDRRYFSQTNSCPDCGVQLFFEKNGSGETIFHQAPALEKTLEMLRSGQTVAVKGIGGYLLLCDATDAAAIQNLRQRKHRPAKPFAVLYPSLELLRGDALVRPEEEDLLIGPVSPIVLLRLLPSPASGLAAELIAQIGRAHV